ncbi:efflux RND transporter periplasmic adaptor subunit [Chitinophaga sp. 30R24]|uniref:efflux RND transporter periplasmic adaptor subunit n=1 Tax=Chitinophaga sp. 30R24 TaxID=3248838 RepID=UPI003B8EECDF
MNRVQLRIMIVYCIAFYSCRPHKPPPNPPIPVNLLAVTAEHVTYYDQYPATTVAISVVNLLPQVQGYITGIFFKEGTLVKKGQKLYEIDTRLYLAAYNAAVGNLKMAQGTLVQAQQDADRYVYLNKYKAVASQLYDHAVITLKNAEAQVMSSQADVKTAKTNLSYATIYAPFDGTIGLSQVKIGNMVTVGQTLLNTISTNNPMGVDFLINEKQLAHFRQLKQQPPLPGDSLFSILMPDNSLYPELGKISVIDRGVDPQTGTITVRLVFPNPQNWLKDGMSCIVRVHNQDITPQIVIPGRAVVEQMGEYFVFVAKDTVMRSGHDTAHINHLMEHHLYALQRKVMPGQTLGANVIIKSGINVGDSVVVDGLQSLQDGSRITTGNAHHTSNKN